MPRCCVRGLHSRREATLGSARSASRSRTLRASGSPCPRRRALHRISTIILWIGYLIAGWKTRSAPHDMIVGTLVVNRRRPVSARFGNTMRHRRGVRSSRSSLPRSSSASSRRSRSRPTGLPHSREGGRGDRRHDAVAHRDQETYAKKLTNGGAARTFPGAEASTSIRAANRHRSRKSWGGGALVYKLQVDSSGAMTWTVYCGMKERYLPAVCAAGSLGPFPGPLPKERENLRCRANGRAGAAAIARW